MEAAVGGGIKAGITWPPISRASTTQVSAALGRSSTNAATTPNQKPLSSSSSNSNSGFSFTHPLRSLWRKGHNDGIALDDVKFVNCIDQEVEEREKNGGSWVLKILDVQSLWKDHGKTGVLFDEQEKEQVEVREESNVEGSEEVEESCSSCDDEGGCSIEEEEENVEFDRDSFSKLLKRVSLTEAKLYARMSYLGSLAYTIPTIKPASLLKHHGLRFVTSSLEKKALSTDAGEEKVVQGEEAENKPEGEEQKASRARITAFTAFHVAASAASYLQSHTRGILSFKSSKPGIGDSSHDKSENSVDKEGEINGKADVKSSELASFVATTGSVTAVVAAKEETKQAVAKKLSSGSPSPCEWFICDDDQKRTRIFVIQGSDSLASWQANLLFEPIQFEGLDVLVHRGIYEAAKGIYEQMLPEVQSHLQSYGDSATFRFTGHSLGGSLSLLVNLMLLIRGEVPISALLPVIMFGAPSIMCGGDQLLHKLGLPRNHVQAITMHRDIVPRAFSCNYPDHVAELLKAVNGNFRNHPCLKTQKVLYAPMGNILILQPEEKFSPPHDLLPSGSGLYLLTSPLSDSADPEKQLKAAKAVFFNTPHPLEILSDRSAYGTDGAIYRDHDMHSYLKSVLGVIRLELNQIRKTKREQRRKVWWPSIVPRPRRVHGGVVVEQPAPSHNAIQSQLTFSGIFHNGRETVKRFSRLVASQHMHLLVVFLLPARLLVLGTFAITCAR